MKSVITTSIAVLISIVSITSQAAGRDPFIGEYAGDCSPGTQCWVEIAKSGKAYKVSFVVADRMDATKIKCRVDSTMKRGKVQYTPSFSYDVAIMGDFMGSPTAFIAPNSDGSIIFDGGFTVGKACGKYDWFQTYEPIGW